MSFAQVEKYLTLLQRSGLLEYDGASGYLITDMGIEFLQLYDDYLERSTRMREEVKKATEDRLRLENMCFNNKTPVKQMGNEKDDLT